jgi:hypothetical protein
VYFLLLFGLVLSDFDVWFDEYLAVGIPRGGNLYKTLDSWISHGRGTRMFMRSLRMII